MKIAFAVALTMSAVVLAGPAGISINGSGNGAAVQQGAPVILSITSSGIPASPPDALELSGGPDNARAAALKYRPAASGESTFGTKLVTRTDVWTLDPDQTAALAPGTYSVTLPGGEKAQFSISNGDNASESAADRAGRLLLLSAWAEVAGDNQRAVELVTRLVSDQPTSVAAKLRLSDLLAEKGQLAEALKLLDDAEIEVTRGKRLPHPPIAIRVRQAEILDQMSAGNKQ